MSRLQYTLQRTPRVVDHQIVNLHLLFDLGILQQKIQVRMHNSFDFGGECSLYLKQRYNLCFLFQS